MDRAHVEPLDVFRCQHVGIRFEVTAAHQVSHLSHRKADIAIRLVTPKQQSRCAKEGIAQPRRIVYTIKGHAIVAERDRRLSLYFWKPCCQGSLSGW